MPYLKNVHWVDSGRRLRDRFLEHLTDLPTGRHFTSPGHSVSDMLVSVIRSCLRSLTERRRIEVRMIISLWGARDGPVVRALASHQCGLGSNPGIEPYVGWVCCWFSPLLREVFLRVLLPVFHFVDVLPPNHYLFISSDTGHFNQPDWMRTSTLFSQSQRGHVMLVFVLIFI